MMDSLWDFQQKPYGSYKEQIKPGTITEYITKTPEIIEIHQVVIENHHNPDISKQFFFIKKELFAVRAVDIPLIQK